MKIFFDIQKVDEEQKMVFGYASTEALDSQGEVVKREAIETALDDYMKFANIREMHQPSAVGVAKEATMDDKGLYIAAKVVDPVAWDKVKEGVYKGFSIGGKVTSRDDVNKTVITGLKLTEISLVDRPANPEATFDVFKVDDEAEPEGDAVEPSEVPAEVVDAAEEAKEDVATPPAEKAEVPQTDIDTLAAMLDKGEITPARLIELATKDNAAKGLATVAWFANLLNEVTYLMQETAWEAEYEGDNSEMPNKIKAWLATGVKLLGEHVAEEGAEAVALAEETGDLSKAGAKFSKATKAALANLHKTIKECSDHLDGLGYAEAEEAEDADKADATGDLSKSLSKIAELESELAKAGDRIKELEAMPTVGKALLMAVSKHEETITAAQAEPVDHTVLKADGTVDHEATALALIKAAQSKPILR